MAGSDEPERRPLPLQALAALGHPGSLSVLVEASKDKDTVLVARRALVRFGTAAALEALRDLVEESRDPAFRHETLIMIGEVEVPASVDMLLTFSRRDEAVLRSGAARGLAYKPDDERVQTRLVEMLEDPDQDAAVSALLSLREVGSDSATVSLLRILKDSRDVFVRSTAILTLGRLAPAEAHAAVRKLIKDPDDRLRASAVEALGSHLEDHLDDARLLIEALKDPSNRVRGNAIVGLWPVDPEVCRKPFADLMHSSRQVNRSTAAWVIGQVQAPELFQAYLPVINTELDKDVLAMALSSIEEAVEPRLVGTIGKLLVHPNQEIRVRATRSFARMAGPADRPTLLSALTKERDPKVKAAMLSTLGALSDSANFPDIFPFLDDRDNRVVANALEALGKVGDLAVAPILRDHLSARHPRTRANALVALFRVGDFEDVPRLLVEMLRQEEAEPVGSACFACQTLGEDVRHAVGGDGELPPLEAALEVEAERLGEEDLEALQSPAVRAADRSADWEVELAAAFRSPTAMRLAALPEKTPAAVLGRFVQTRLDGSEIAPEQEEIYRTERFLPALFLALEQARSAPNKDNKLIQTRYLELARAQLRVYEEFLVRSLERAEQGRDAQVYKMLNFIFRQLKLSPDIHETFAAHYLSVKEYDLAYEHLLKAYAGNPENVEFLLQAAGACIRISKLRVARELLETVRARVEPGSPLLERTAAMLQLVEKAADGEG